MKYTKIYYKTLLRKFILPFISLYHKEESTIIIPGEIEASYENSTMRLESFSRSLLGWAMLDGDDEIKETIFMMIKNGINRQSDKYWGKIKDNDQKIVEMFPILLFCVENKNLYEKLFDNDARENMQQWFLQINQVHIPLNNWQFFIVLVNTFLRLLGLNYSKKAIDESFKQIERMYIGDGWYSDGETFQRDYYIPFALHYYSLLYSKYCPEDERAIVFLERSKLFAKYYIRFFSKDGNSIPFGRSLTYKFAQVAFWAMYSNFIEDEYELSIIKGVINRNIEWWLAQDIVDSNGFLNIGYSYSNQFMTEYYNAKGSSYWCLKAFIFLLNKSDAFFNIKPLEMVREDYNSFIPALFSTLLTYNGQSYLFMNGQNSNNEFGNTAAKYEKFMYSTVCAPCVSRSPYGIENLAYDNSLVVQMGETFLVRKHCQVIENSEKALISIWNPIAGLSIQTYVFPGVPYHYRVHVVRTNLNLKIYDFGSAVRNDRNLEISIKENRAICCNKNQASSIYTLGDKGLADICICSPNVNLQYPKVVIPYSCSDFTSGSYYIINCCYNDISVGNGILDDIEVDSGGISYRGRKYHFNDFPHSNGSVYSSFIGIIRKFKLIMKYFQ